MNMMVIPEVNNRNPALRDIMERSGAWLNNSFGLLTSDLVRDTGREIRSNIPVPRVKTRSLRDVF
jgi:hypothetical protein